MGLHFIEEVFGKRCDLYKDVLGCERDADKSKLRKAYYRKALEYHPDRNRGNEHAHKQFQAISMAYQILQDPDSRADYDDTGVIPDAAPDDDDKNAANNGTDQWKHYFDQIFGKLKRSDIDAFASKYKCSDEERRDVLKEFKKRKGNLVKMLDFVMLSEPRDATRWVEDYIVPAMDDGSLSNEYKSIMEKTLKTCQKKAEKEMEQEEEAADASGSDDDVDYEDGVAKDEDETETDGEEEDDEDDEDVENQKKPPTPQKASSKSTQSQTKVPPKKANATQAKHQPKQQPQKKQKKKKDDKKNDMSSLVAQIQNRHKGGGNVFASLGARYGVSMEDDDPMNDAEFDKIQSRMNQNKNKRQRKN